MLAPEVAEYCEVGQAYYLVRGHGPVAVEGCGSVEFWPSQDFRAFLDDVYS